MIRLVGFVATTFALVCGARPASAQDGHFALGTQVGTPGVGVTAEYSISPNFVARESFDVLNINRDETYDDLEYTAKVEFSSPALFLDWYLAGGVFFVSAGAYLGDRNVKLDATPTGPTRFGDQTFTSAQIGNISGKVEL